MSVHIEGHNRPCCGEPASGGPWFPSLYMADHPHLEPSPPPSVHPAENRMPRETNITKALDRAVGTLPFAASQAAAERLTKLAVLVEVWGARMNLSGHRSAEVIAAALIGDAIGLLGQIEALVGSPLEGHLVDLGSGAGFPGLPIAVLRSGLEVHMVEAREKRHHFQRAARRQLGLTNAHPIHGRIEANSIAGADWVVAQAVGPIAEVIKSMRPYARGGGRLIVPGSDRLKAPAGFDDYAGQVISYRSPMLDQSRKLWIGIAPEA